MYMKLLEQTIKELKGEEIEDEVRANVNLRVDLRIDGDYVPDMNQRLTVYRRMAAVRSEPELERLIEEVRDRYGPPPDSVLNLAEYAAIRILSDRIRVDTLDREGDTVVLKFRSDAKLDPARLFRLVQQRGDLRLVPPGTLRLDLKAAARTPQAPGKRDAVAGGSWWTARARAGEVTPGFTRDEIMRPATEDPRREGGLFTRVSSLLRELSDGASIG
jgi:transcription-repair coupling factor (superfamily II helicase)